MANTKVYIHEFIEIIGHNRANYMHHMAANWSPIAQVERDQLCYGVWGTVGTTRRWPEVVNLWEEDGFDGMASSFRHEFNHPTLQDPALHEWWAKASEFRSGGLDRLLIPAPWTDTIEELCAKGVKGETYAHELLKVEQGAAWDVLDIVKEKATAALEAYNWVLAGAWATAMCNDSEVFLLWAIPSWEDWGAYEKNERDDDTVVEWRQAVAGPVKSWDRFLLVDAPLSPMRIGRQPAVSDRDSYELS